MNSIYEALKGFTDIPSAVVALVLGLLALRRRDREGAALFLIIAAGGFLGSAVHIFELPELIRRIVWVFLHMALFEAVLRFTLLFSSFSAAAESPGQSNSGFWRLCYVSAP